VAAFANWPGVLKPGKLTAPLHAADWMPTLTKLAGWQRPAHVKFDGLDIWPLLKGAAGKPETRTVYIPHTSGAAVYHGNWKLIARNGRNAKTELFNVSEDPFETTDLAAREPGRVQALQAMLAELRQDDRTKLPDDLARLPAENQ
jgi:arylsulfatase A-like enzyme